MRSLVSALLAPARSLALVVGMLVAVAPWVAAQTRQPGATPNVGGGDATPPAITITPGTENTAVATVAVTIQWCDNVSLNAVTRNITLDGTNVTASFTYVTGTSPGCGAFARSTGSLTLTSGPHTLRAIIKDNALNQGTASVTYTFSAVTYGVTVSPHVQAISAPAERSSQALFSFVNSGNGPEVINLTVTCTGTVTGCPTSLPPDTVPVGEQGPLIGFSYQAGPGGETGAVTLTATVAENPAVHDAGTYNVTSEWASYLFADASFDNQDNQNSALCAANCFTAAYAQSTVPYFSLGQARQVTLSYNGDRVALRPFVYTDVHLGDGAYTNLQQYWLEAQINGVDVPFTNGETKLHFTADPSNPQKVLRLAGQLDMEGYATGTYDLVLLATAQYADHTETALPQASQLLLVNERTSPVARGWTVAGIQHLYLSSDGKHAMITDGTGSALDFTCTFSTLPCSVQFTSPPGDFSLLTVSGSGASTIYTRAFPDSSKVLFNNLGQMTATINRFGLQVLFSYDASGRLATITDPVRKFNGVASATCLWYGSTWGLDSIREPGTNGASCQGRKTTFTVAGDSTLQSIQDPDGKITQFTYDAAKRLATIVDRRGDATTYAYNPTTWKLDSIIGPRVPVDTLGTGSTTMLSSVIRYHPWQPQGVPTGATSVTPAVPITPASVIASVTDAEHHTSTFTVDRWGQPLVATDPLGRVTTFVRSGIFAVGVHYPSGAKDTTIYNSMGLPTFSVQKGVDTTLVTYGTFAVPTLIVGSQPTQKFVYGANGVLSSTTVAGVTTTYVEDNLDRPMKIADSRGHTTRFHYDAVFGNADSTITADSVAHQVQAVGVRFDAFGRDSISAAAGQPADTTTYDVMNRVIRIAVPGPGAGKRVTTFAYDPLFQTQITDAQGQIFRDSVNAVGWVIQHTDPAGKVIKYTYNRDGLVTSTTNRRLQLVSMSYDALHRLLSESGAQMMAKHFSFNPLGTVVTASDSVSTEVTYSDPLTGWTDSVVTTLHGHQFARYYRPNAMRQLDSLGIRGPDNTNGIGFVGRRYFWSDSTGLLDSVAVGTNHFRFHRNSEELVDTTTFGNGTKRSTSYSPTHQPFQLTFTQPSLDMLSRSYLYDSLGRIVEDNRSIHDDSSTQVSHYTYDALGQLSSMTFKHITSTSGKPLDCTNPGGGVTPVTDFGADCLHPDSTSTTTVDKIVGFAYDSVGNMRLWFDTTASIPVFGSFVTPDRMTGWAGNTYASDADGNRITRVEHGFTTTFHWTADGLMDSVIASPSHLGYLYDASGRLVARTRNGHVERYFLWDHDQLLAELDSSATHRIAEYAYLPGTDAPIELLAGASPSAPSVNFYAQDATGSVVGLFNASLAIKERSTLSPWGRQDSLTTSLADTNRLRWKGLVFEGDSTRLYYVRARWYDPASNRFMSEDPAGTSGGINPYLFAANDPVNFRDPSGMFIDIDCSMTVEGCGGHGGGGFDMGDQGMCSIFLPCDGGDITTTGVDGQPWDMETVIANVARARNGPGLALGCRMIPKTGYLFGHCGFQLTFDDGTVLYAELEGSPGKNISIQFASSATDFENGDLFSTFYTVASGGGIANQAYGIMLHDAIYYDFNETPYSPWPCCNSNEWAMSVLGRANIPIGLTIITIANLGIPLGSPPFPNLPHTMPAF